MEFSQGVQNASARLSLLYRRKRDIEKELEAVQAEIKLADGELSTRIYTELGIDVFDPVMVTEEFIRDRRKHLEDWYIENHWHIGQVMYLGDISTDTAQVGEIDTYPDGSRRMATATTVGLDILVGMREAYLEFAADDRFDIVEGQGE